MPRTDIGGIIQRIFGYKGSTEKLLTNTVLIGNKRHYITSIEIFNHLHHTVDNMTGLGFKGKDVDTHSIRLSLAVSLYLVRRPLTTIILLGRWCSDAFLLYIR